MKKAVALVLLLSFCFSQPALAQVSIKAEVDKLVLSTDELLSYKVFITTQEKKLLIPQFPAFEGFQIVSQVENSNMSYAQGKVKGTFVYSLILAPKAVGRFKIAPSVIKAGEKSYSSAEFVIEVTQGKRIIPSPSENKPLPPQKVLPDSRQPQVNL